MLLYHSFGNGRKSAPRVSPSKVEDRIWLVALHKHLGRLQVVGEVPKLHQQERYDVDNIKKVNDMIIKSQMQNTHVVNKNAQVYLRSKGEN